MLLLAPALRPPKNTRWGRDAQVKPPFKVEYAKSGRSTCVKCKNKIDQARPPAHALAWKRQGQLRAVVYNIMTRACLDGRATCASASWSAAPSLTASTTWYALLARARCALWPSARASSLTRLRRCAQWRHSHCFFNQFSPSSKTISGLKQLKFPDQEKIRQQCGVRRASCVRFFLQLQPP